MLFAVILSFAQIAAAATNPPAYTGPMTIAACYNQTNGQVRLVKPWGPTPDCIPPAPYAVPSTSTLITICSEGGAFDCRTSESFVELNTQGPKGDKGDTGPAGPQGPKGDQGPQGYSATVSAAPAVGCYQITIMDSAGVPVPGAVTAAVCDGASGKDGAPGAPGAPGMNGAPGQAATIAVGSTTTVTAGTPASVTNGGSANAAVLDFSIPQGPKGDKGDTGPAGPQGLGAGTFCGRPTGPHTGSAGGWVGVNGECRSVCGDNSGHICSAEEIMRTWRVWGYLPSSAVGWYATYRPTRGSFDPSRGSSEPITDCDNFTSPYSNICGNVFDYNSGNPIFDVLPCSVAKPILCCKD